MYGYVDDPAAQSRVRDNIRYYTSLGPDAVSRRIRQLDLEWDMSRAVSAGLSGLGVFGLVVGLLGGRSFRLFTWMSLPLLFAASLGRWTPPAELTARWGLRTRREIEEERYALKALRGDFREVGGPSSEETGTLDRAASQVLDAVRA